MEPVAPSPQPPRRPVPPLFIGALLLLGSTTLLVARLVAPEGLAGIEPLSGVPTATHLLIMLGGLYLLGCLPGPQRLRLRWQRIVSSTLILASLLPLLDSLISAPPLSLALPATNTLLAFLVAGFAALLNPSARTLSHLAITFLLILLAASLAILGLTVQGLGYDPFFPSGMGGAMDSYTATALLLFAAGLAYSIWWSHRHQAFDPISGITLLAATLLIFSALFGASVIYTVSAAHLHFEARQDLMTLLNERTARIVDTLRNAESHATLLSYDALRKDGTLWSQHLADDYALRVVDQGGRVIAQYHGEWFDKTTLASIAAHDATLWRGEEGRCQLRITRQIGDSHVEIGVPLNLLPMLGDPQGDGASETLTLCGHAPDGALHCLGANHHEHDNAAPLLASSGITPHGKEVTRLFLNDGNIEAVMALPEFGLVAYMEKSHHQIFGPLYTKLSLTLPLGLLLLAASVALIAWRIQPLAKNLQRSEQRYRSLVDGAADAIFLHDSSRRFIEANAAATAMLGYPHDTLLGMHPDDFLLPEDQSDASAQLARMGREPTIINTRRQLRRKDGSLLPVEIRATRIDSGQMISVVRDISEQQQAEATLREKERFLRSVVEVLAEGVVVYREDGAIVYTNQTAQKILGHDGHDGLVSAVAARDPRHEVIHEDGSPYSPATQPAMMSLRQGISKRDAVMGVTRTDGIRIWIEVNSDPLWNEQRNTIIGAVASFRDISDKRETERALYQSRERLRALSTHLLQIREEEKSLIAREIHDELGSSLTAIKMGIEWLNEKTPGEFPELRARLHHLTQVAAQAVLATRRLVSQLSPTILEDLGLWAALEWLLRELGRHSAIEVNYAMQCSHITLGEQEAVTVYRVIQEALNNIAKHAKARSVRLDCWEGDGLIHITVEDDGVGIEEDATYRINSFGIRGMYERVGKIHGTLQILGSPGEGTLLSITVPYHHSQKEVSHD